MTDSLKIEDRFVNVCVYCFFEQVKSIFLIDHKLLYPYKSYEPHRLIDMARNFKDEETILDQSAKLLSKLILIQAFPNANHRTAFFFVGLYLAKQGIRTIKYEDAPQKYHDFYKISKELLSSDINCDNVFDESYCDAIHDAGMGSHLKAAKKQMELIIVPIQSGIRTAESLQSFLNSFSQ